MHLATDLTRALDLKPAGRRVKILAVVTTAWLPVLALGGRLLPENLQADAAVRLWMQLTGVEYAAMWLLFVLEVRARRQALAAGDNLLILSGVMLGIQTMVLFAVLWMRWVLPV